MESFQRDVIRRNEKQLLEKTRCGETFLAIFSSRDILGQEDIENIKAQGNNYGNTRMSKEFYNIIITRENAFDILLEALRETKQTGVLEILNKETPSVSTTPKQGKLMRFIESPDFIKEFLERSTNVMIISTKDCKITCERILEQTPRAIDFMLEHFINYVSTREGRSSTTNIAVVNCGNNIDKGFSGARNLTSKIVLVTSVDTVNLKKSFTTPKKSKIRPYLTEDNFTWDDLSPGYQELFESSLNNQLHLNETVKWFDDGDVDTDNIIDLLNDKPLQIFKDTLPENIKYYIPRQIINRRILTNEIFRKGGTDIYLFENMERHKLRELADEYATETSTTLVNSANYFNHQFIILEKAHHFEHISKKYNDRPVHVLYYHENDFEWKRSSGSIHNIQTSLSAEQPVQQEADFMHDIISNSTRCPVCISDTPGMGKSVLLAHFTRILRERTDKIVCFVVITELVKMVRDNKIQSTLNKTTLSSALAKYLAKNKLGEAFVNKHPDEIKELMFDGFDELNSEDISLGYNILKTFQVDFQQTRIWVTTRPHMFFELEKNLVVLGSNIQSFAEQDQVNFLKSFWCRNYDSLDENQSQKDKLESFAMSCLASLKSAIDNKEEDIAGIPLQCMLIGEVFEDEAKQHFNSKDNESLQNISSEVSITSMVNLYEKLIEIKIDKYHKRYGKELDSSKLIKMHTYLSIWLLFPRSRKFGEKRLCLHSFSTNVQQLFNVGILESRSLLPAPRFLHRTFAEYFLAKFVVDSLAINPDEPSKKEKRKKIEDEDLRNFLFTHVLKTKVTNLKANRTSLKTFEFKNNVVCYFINALLPNMLGKIDENIVWVKSESELMQLMEACAYNDFYQIYKGFVHKNATHVTYKQTVFTEKFLKVIISRGDCLLFELAYPYFKECNSVSISDIKHHGYTLLHLAVIRGNFSVVETLVSKENFKDLLVIKDKTFDDILHDCMQNTKQSIAAAINDKISIISYISQINEDFLFQENTKGYLPVECKGVNSTLVEHLFNCGGRGYEAKRLVVRLLHRLTKNLNSKEYGSFMQLIFSGKDENVVKDIVNSLFGKRYLLDSIFDGIEPENELMELLKLFGVNFTKTKENSILYLAVKNKRNANCISWLLSNTDFNNDDITKALSIRSGSIFLVRYLLECKHIDVTSFPTLFHFICNRSTLSSEHIELIQQLISRNVDVNYENENSKTAINYLLDSKCDKNSLEVLKLIQESPNYIVILDLDFLIMQWIIKGLDPLNFIELTRKYVTDVEQVTTRDAFGYTLLHKAVQTGNIDKVRLAFSFCPDINAANNFKQTALHLLTRTKEHFCIDCWMFLVNNGADVCALDDWKRCPLVQLQCLENSEASLAVMFVLTNIFPNGNSSVERILWHVIRVNDLEVIRCACEWYKSNVQTPFEKVKTNVNGAPSTFLDAALQTSNGDVLEYVLQDLKCSTMESSPVDSIFKCINNKYVNLDQRLKFIKVLTHYYSNLDLLNSTNSNGRFPLSLRGSYEDFVKLFVELGANINARDADDNIPLHCVLKQIWDPSDDDLKLIEQHIKCGANVNAVNKQQETPLLLATNLGSLNFPKVVNLLIKNNADPSITDSSGNNILHLASERYDPDQEGFFDILKCLQVHGYADLLKSRNNANCTPLDLLKQKGEPFCNEIVQILGQYGIDV